MAQRNRNRDQDRYARSGYDRDGYRQQEQFSDYTDDQFGDSSRYDRGMQGGSDYGAGSEIGGDYGRSYGASDYGRSNYDRDRSDRYADQDRYASSNYGSSGRGSGGYGERDRYGDYDRGSARYGSRQGSSYTGSGFGEGSRDTGYERGFGNDYDRDFGSVGRSYDRSYDRSSRRDYHDDERGFFEKAGDEVASWFGDRDAERRRRMDHRGRGPANYERSNERLLEDACERLTHDWGVDASNINVTADNNEITLDGTVDSRQAKRRAEDCVHDISGVNHVQNNLRVDNSGRYGSYSDRNDTTMTGTSGTETA